MSKVLGYFVFQQAGDGCILAKYSNWTLRSPLVEAGKLTPMNQTVEGFEGAYLVTWIENPAFAFDAQTARAMLTINRKPETTGIFSLLWDDGPRFFGEGMLFNDFLSGVIGILNYMMVQLPCLLLRWKVNHMSGERQGLLTAVILQFGPRD